MLYDAIELWLSQRGMSHDFATRRCLAICDTVGRASLASLSSRSDGVDAAGLIGGHWCGCDPMREHLTYKMDFLVFASTTVYPLLARIMSF